MIERLLVLKLDVAGCEAEASLNGMPVVRAHPGSPRVAVPVHEYTLAGDNRMELTVWPHAATLPEADRPPPQPLVSQGLAAAHARLLLPRVGRVADESASRTLAQLDWAPPEGTRFQAPVVLHADVQLPVSFPRWRWLEAPAVGNVPGLADQARAHVQSLATSLAEGDPEPFLVAARLRTEELAVAYQEDPRESTDRLRRQLRSAFEAGRLRWQPLDGLVLRRIAGGRLLECLSPEGAPALCTQADEDGRTLALPLRMAFVENRFYVLR
jgi:hypothetical protein